MLKLSKNKGFTIMELIIVVAIIAILMTISVFGISSYLDNADKLERDNAAKTTYMALQDYLTSIKKTGGLEDFNKSVASYCSKITDDQIKSILEKHYTENTGAKISEYFEDHNGTEVVALTFSSGNKAHPLYSILFDCLADADALDKSFVIEYNQTTGSVMSVFYSKSIDSFNRSSLYSSAFDSEYNIVLRDKDSLGKKKQGYYGVYKTALKGGELLADAADNEYHVSLINDDRIYLDIVDTTPYTLNENVSYTVDLYVEGSKTPLDTFVFRRQDIVKQANVNQTTTSLLDIIDNIDGTTGDRAVCRQGVTTDEGNTADEYYVLIDCEHHNNVDEKYAEKILELTGKPAEKSKIYASVSLVANGAIADLGTTDSINPVFEDYDEARNIFFMSCTRHLNNIRNYGQNNSYALSNDINLKEFEREEDDHTVVEDKADRHYYEAFEMIKCKNSDGNPVEFLGDFVGVKSIATDKTVDLMDVKNTLTSVKPEDCFTVTAINIIRPNVNEIGLFHNLPADAIVGGVNFDELCVTGAEQVGGVCVKNKGRIEGVFVTNADIKGKIYVGGIISTASGPLTNLSFSGSVEGLRYYDNKVSADSDPKKYLGGIVSESYHNITDCYFEGKVFSDETNVSDQYFGGITGRTWDGAAISKCTIKNFELRGEKYVGGIVGYADGPVSDCEISGTYILDNSHAPKADFEACIGGVAGATTKQGTITNCNIRCPEGVVSGVFYDKYTSDMGSKAMGGLVGLPYGNIDNCYVELKRVDGFRDIGGIAGRCFSDKVSNCTVKIETIECDGYAGGIVGVLYKDGGIIENCSTLAILDDAGKRTGGEILVRNNGDGRGHSGGILGVHSAHKTVGSADSKTVNIMGCENNLNIHANMKYNYSIEGLGGITSGSKTINMYITDCINNGDITVEYDTTLASSAIINYVAGIAGGSTLTTTIPDSKNIDINDYKSGIVNIKNCKNTGNILFKNNVKGTFVGGIFGSNTKLNKECVIDGCINEGNIIAENKSAQYVGGIMGGRKIDAKNDLVEQTITIKNCVNIGNLTNVYEAGGIFGRSDSKLNLNIENCVSGVKKENPNDDDVTKYQIAASYAGGFVGKTDHAETVVNISSCINYADITDMNIASLNNISGGVGHCQGPLSISSSENWGNIRFSGNGKYVGGLAGGYSTRLIGTKDYNFGYVHAEAELNEAGGIVGGASGPTVLSECHNTGVIDAKNKVQISGGIIGRINGDISVLDCVNDGSIIASNGSLDKIGGLIGLAARDDDFHTIIERSVNNGEMNAVTTISNVGGLVGNCYMGECTIKNSDNNGKFSSGGSMTNTSGIMGRFGINAKNSGGEETVFGKSLVIDGCNNTGSMESKGEIKESGGIAGYVYGGAFDVLNTNNKGNINTEKNCTNVAGLVGRYGYGYKKTNGDYVFGATLLEIDGCKNDSEIIALGSLTSVSGAIGYVDVGELQVLNTENKGIIKAGTTMNGVGGVVGKYGSQYANLSGGYYVKTTKATVDNTSNYAVIESDGAQTGVGGIIGYIYRGEVIAKNSNNEGNIISQNTGKSVGGILGKSEISTTIDKCNNSGTIIAAASFGTDNDGVGGIMGSSYDINKVVISECNNTGDLQFGTSVSKRVAGILGLKKNNFTEGEKRFEIVNCKNAGNIKPISEGSTITVNNAAGILGLSQMTTDQMLVKITACENTGDIYNAGNNCGGIAGEVQSKFRIDNCKNGNEGKKVTIKGIFNGAVGTGGILGYSKLDNDCNIYYLEGSSVITSCDSNADIIYKTPGAASNIGGCIGFTNGGVYLSKINTNGNISVEGNITNTGGMSGYVTKTICAEKCVNNANIKSTGYARSVGGISGIVKMTVSIKDSNNNGTLEAKGGMGENDKQGVGGILGTHNVASGLSFVNCNNTGDIIFGEKESYNVGGIFGIRITDGGSINIEECKNSGNIKPSSDEVTGAVNRVGGLIGYVNVPNTRLVISKCDNKGSLYHTANSAGGFAGEIKCSYSITNSSNGTEENHVSINGFRVANDAKNVGGFIGFLESNNEKTVQNITTYADIDYKLDSGKKLSYAGGIFGKLNGDMYSCSNIQVASNINVNQNMEECGGIVGSATGAVRPFDFNGNITADGNMKYVGRISGKLNDRLDSNGQFKFGGDIIAGKDMDHVGGAVGYTINQFNPNGNVIISGDILAGGNMTYVAGVVGETTNQMQFNNEIIIESNISADGNMTDVAVVVGKTTDLTSANNKMKLLGDITAGGSMTKVAGLIGETSGQAQFNNEVNIDSNITAGGNMTNVSGFISSVTNQVQFNNTINVAGDIEAAGNMTKVAGLIAEINNNQWLSIKGNYTGNIVIGGTADSVGGLIGYLKNSNGGQFTGMSFTGDLVLSDQPVKNVGGLFGYVEFADYYNWREFGNLHHIGKISRDKISGDSNVGYIMGYYVNGNQNIYNVVSDKHWSYRPIGNIDSDALPNSSATFEMDADIINNLGDEYTVELQSVNGSTLTNINKGSSIQFKVMASNGNSSMPCNAKVTVIRKSNGAVLSSEDIVCDDNGIYTVTNIQSYIVLKIEVAEMITYNDSCYEEEPTVSGNAIDSDVPDEDDNESAGVEPVENQNLYDYVNDIQPMYEDISTEPAEIMNIAFNMPEGNGVINDDYDMAS